MSSGTTSPTPPSKPLTVSEFTRRLRELVEPAFDGVWIEAELSNVTVAATGHIYLKLKDAQALVEAVMWRSTAVGLKYRPEPGSRVLAFGRLSIYPPQGRYQLVLERLLPTGQGELDAALKALEDKLRSEGLFEASRKRPLPFLPRMVGVVTSPTGAARRDIEAVLHRRSPQVPIVLFPATVQGESAPAEVERGILALAAIEGVDVIIVGRGGGSAEDLAAFNTERVARAIAACPVPVVSAVGHETDTTLADRVADLRAATPSVAAEQVVPVRDDLLALIAGLAFRLGAGVEQGLERRRESRRHIVARLLRSLSLAEVQRRLTSLSTRLSVGVDRRLRVSRSRMATLDLALAAQQPTARVLRSRAALQKVASRLEAVGGSLCSPERAQLALAVGRLEALSPLASLDRGYSLTRREDGQIVKSVDDVREGQVITTLLRQGRLTSRVMKVGEDHG